MILDYDYNQREKKFVISYINEKGTKSFYECSVSRFKTYYPTPTGKYRNWDVADVLKIDPSYVHWWATAVAQPSVKEKVRIYLKNLS